MLQKDKTSIKFYKCSLITVLLYIINSCRKSNTKIFKNPIYWHGQSKYDTFLNYLISYCKLISRLIFSRMNNHTDFSHYVLFCLHEWLLILFCCWKLRGKKYLKYQPYRINSFRWKPNKVWVKAMSATKLCAKANEIWFQFLTSSLSGFDREEKRYRTHNSRICRS